MTYSAVVRDAATGTLGVAVQSHYFAVGCVVPWAEAGVGAVATQAFPNVDYGPRGIAAMRNGFRSSDVLKTLVVEDAHAEARQVAMIDRRGEVAVHTGSRCIDAAGSRSGDGWCVQGNLLTDEGVLDAMAEALDGSDSDVAERLMAALRAGEAAGGDLRGSQAAAILVVSGQVSPRPWTQVLVNLRVDDSSAPIAELDRLMALHGAGTQLGRAFSTPGLVIGTYGAEAEGVVDDVLSGLELADAELGRDNPEAELWRGVVLARAGRNDEARCAFASVLSRQPGLRDIAERLVSAGILDDPAVGQIFP